MDELNTQQKYEQKPIMPDNYQAKAIIATIIGAILFMNGGCGVVCLPFGIVSLIKSAKVKSLYDAGDYAGAQLASEDTKKWIKWSFISAGICVALIVIAIILYTILIAVGAIAEYR